MPKGMDKRSIRSRCRPRSISKAWAEVDCVVFLAVTFLIGTIYLKDHVYLQLEPNSTILGSDSLADYGNDVGLNPFYPETIDPCLIYAKNAVDIGIQGKGKIVGHTKNTFTPPPAGETQAGGGELPMLIRFDACSQICQRCIALPLWRMVHASEEQQRDISQKCSHSKRQAGRIRSR